MDEEEAQEAKKEGVRALKKRRRKEALAYAPIKVCSNDTLNAELLEHLIAKQRRRLEKGPAMRAFHP